MSFRHQHTGRVVSPRPGTAGYDRCVRLPVWEQVEEPETPELDDAGPVQLGGGWYQMPDGSKVRGNPEDD